MRFSFKKGSEAGHSCGCKSWMTCDKKMHVGGGARAPQRLPSWCVRSLNGQKCSPEGGECWQHQRKTEGGAAQGTYEDRRGGAQLAMGHRTRSPPILHLSLCGTSSAEWSKAPRKQGWVPKRLSATLSFTTIRAIHSTVFLFFFFFEKVQLIKIEIDLQNIILNWVELKMNSKTTQMLFEVTRKISAAHF